MSKSTSTSTSISKEQQKEEQETHFSSPTSVILPSLPNHQHHQQQHNQHHQDDNFKLTPSSYPINLEQFIQLLPDTIRSSNTNTKHASSTTVLSTSRNMNMNNRSSMNRKMVDMGSSGSGGNGRSSSSNGNHDDPIGTLFRRLSTTKEELTPYCFIEPNKNYTRNLISTDDETYTLLLLCWNPGKYSPIHDHPCDGCWMQVCQGCVNEVRYDVVKEDKDGDKDDEHEEEKEKGEQLSSFICTMDTTFEKGQQTFIDDNLGYHKVGNPSKDVLAISMHLYSPPFQKCKIWLDPRDASSSSISCMCNFSEYGHRVKTMKN